MSDDNAGNAPVDLEGLQEKLGVTFQDWTMLAEALAHSSYHNENPDSLPRSNERLEFLGDAVLGLVIAEQLYSEFPEVDEGKLSKMRAALVQMESLADASANLGLGPFLLLGQGEESSGGRSRPSNIARALEAIIGAIFLDQGLDCSREFILRALEDRWWVVALGISNDYKSQLQEKVQASLQSPPTYRLLGVSGPDNGRVFTVEVLVGEDLLGRGQGRSKKAAEREAARLALERLEREALSAGESR
jgi:ribonuclease III